MSKIMAMEIRITRDEELEFLTDPVDRFPLPDLAGDKLPVEHGRSQAVICGPTDSSIGEAGDAMAVVETYLNNTCQGVTLSAPASEQSTGKDDLEAPGWTRRIRVGANNTKLCREKN
ncbi:uncharacterized protein LOC119268117 [Triticum dicoccoides]|uniref:uncharacterized protein LOC119268117 n=1 Tax=Triticum dicoccoides TaxID=85692 RepID=UPI001890271D|nr:uncharacterized protein LOC119268117 [Triticum dicoccoides]